MVKSMTGYGRAQNIVDDMNITVELKSVNHRFLECSVRCPRNFNYLEEKLKSFLRTKLFRGKVEMFITIEAIGSSFTEIEINKEYAESYINALKALAENYGLLNDISVSSVARNNDVFKTVNTEFDEDKVSSAVIFVAEQAVNSFIKMRETEGLRLKEDVEKRSEVILNKVEYIEKASPETVKNYRERLEEKIKDLLSDTDADEQRIITETAIFADKIAVDEETVRLRSHIKQLRELLDKGDDTGKKLDFIIQEMNREANTIGSKSQNINITKCVVDIKSEIEKIREQIQNIE